MHTHAHTHTRTHTPWVRVWRGGGAWSGVLTLVLRLKKKKLLGFLKPGDSEEKKKHFKSAKKKNTTFDVCDEVFSKKNNTGNKPAPHAHTRTHTHTCFAMHTHTLTHTREHTHTRTHTRTHTHTHKHTQKIEKWCQMRGATPLSLPPQHPPTEKYGVWAGAKQPKQIINWPPCEGFRRTERFSTYFLKKHLKTNGTEYPVWVRVVCVCVCAWWGEGPRVAEKVFPIFKLFLG